MQEANQLPWPVAPPSRLRGPQLPAVAPAGCPLLPLPVAPVALAFCCHLAAFLVPCCCRCVAVVLRFVAFLLVALLFHFCFLCVAFLLLYCCLIVAVVLPFGAFCSLFRCRCGAFLFLFCIVFCCLFPELIFIKIAGSRPMPQQSRRCKKHRCGALRKQRHVPRHSNVLTWPGCIQAAHNVGRTPTDCAKMA